MRSFKDVKRRLLSDYELRKEYEILGPEFDVRASILRLRLSRNMTQVDLAKRLGTTQEYVSKLERGKVSFSVAYLSKLADALDADLHIHMKPRDKVKV